MSPVSPQIKNRIWISRLKRGFSRKRLSRLLGYSANDTLKKWESGRRTPTLESALLLAHLLGTPVEALFKDLRADVVRNAQARLATERSDAQVVNTIS